MSDIRIQHTLVALGAAKDQTGKELPVFITPEWFRSLEAAYKLINELQARVAALEGP